MTPRQKVFALIVCVALFGIILGLVHKRKLREEYAWLWLFTSASLFVLVLWYDLLIWLTELIGAVLPTTTLFLFGLLFFVFITLHFSLKISRLTTQVKDLAQEMALLGEENRELKKALPHQENESSR
ncbi:MAG: DUF2304 domain-containing protein [Desulfatibacillum sp.]|nr:DUF2304 domain-containing protein [Desulfatibacillum sp.]